ncbi:hypothetical protein [Micromonospora sp. NPDC047730]|uniref:hypothetical protein n=1 Tax=Micromonospora sp. NPDC047730 TaxID=3364253 RepID=UPI00371A1A38
MASKSYPRPGYNSGSLTSVEHERLVHTSLPDGLGGHPNDPAPVIADGTGTRVVKVRAGLVVWLRGSYWESGPTDIALPSLEANTSGSPRIDMVVLRLDRSTYEIKEHVITGTPAANPVAPALTFDTGNTGVYDFPLAEVRVNSGVTALPADTVTTRAWHLGEDGQIRCKTSTRPPGQVGRSVFDTEVGRWLVHNGTRWLVAADDSGDLTLPLASGWAAGFNTMRRVNGLVYVGVTIQRKVRAIGTGLVTFAQLPEGFRPTRPFEGVAFAPSSGECRVVINTNGVCQVACYGGLAVDKFVNIHPLVFPAAI